MRRTMVLGALTVMATATAAVLAMSAGGEPRASQAPADFTVTTTFRDRDTSFVDVRPRRRESPGDTVILPGRFTGAGKSGSLPVTCQVVERPRRNRETALCTGSVILADGQISFQGAIVGDPDTVTLSIVGGTGAYNGASGTLTDKTTSERRGRSVSQTTFDFVG
jgi:allene oxide cyclase-like protein